MTIRWHRAWGFAQITPVLFSTLVWILVLGWSLPAGVGLAALGLLHVATRNTDLGLWWRFGARRLIGPERDRMLAALVPIESLRGRGQPVVWRGSRLAGQPMVVPTSRDLVVASSLVTRVSAGLCGEREFCRAVSAALALRPVDASAAVAIVNVYSAPWALLQLALFRASNLSGEPTRTSSVWPNGGATYPTLVWNVGPRRLIQDRRSRGEDYRSMPSF